MLIDLEEEHHIRTLVERRTRTSAIEGWLEDQKKSRAPLYNYRYAHTKQVVEITRELAMDQIVDGEVLVMAAWLHDIAKPDLGEVENHGEESAKQARQILEDLGTDEEKIEKVQTIIRKHVGLTSEHELTPLEAQLLWEADKLVKLGAIGIIHHIINSIRLYPGIDLRALLEKIDSFIPLASEIKNSMKTHRAIAMAEKRFEHLKQFREMLQNELGV
jgi:putative nucleotidyltransferase with HDIG domain